MNGKPNTDLGLIHTLPSHQRAPRCPRNGRTRKSGPRLKRKLLYHTFQGTFQLGQTAGPVVEMQNIPSDRIALVVRNSPMILRLKNPFSVLLCKFPVKIYTVHIPKAETIDQFVRSILIQESTMIAHGD